MRRAIVRGAVVLSLSCIVLLTASPGWAEEKQATQADIADMLVKITGLQSKLPPTAVVGDKMRLLSNFNIVPVGGWNPEAAISSWQVALLVVQAGKIQDQMPSPFRNNMALDKPVVVQEGVLRAGSIAAATDGDPETFVELAKEGWIYIDLGRDLSFDMVSQVIGAVGIEERVYTLQGGGDPSVFPGEWKEAELPKELQGLVPMVHWIEPMSCRYVRWVWSSTGSADARQSPRPQGVARLWWRAEQKDSVEAATLCSFPLMSASRESGIRVSEIEICYYMRQLLEFLVMRNVISREVADQATAALDSGDLAQFFQTVPFAAAYYEEFEAYSGVKPPAPRHEEEVSPIE